MFIINEVVEVEGDADAEFPGAWEPGVILARDGEEVTVHHAQVLEDDYSTAFNEVISLSSGRVRPGLPSELVFSNWDQVKLGQPVDLLYDHTWRQGVISSVFPTGVWVYMSDGTSGMTRSLSELRAGYDWTGALWKKRVVSKAMLKKLAIKQVPDSLPSSLPYKVQTCDIIQHTTRSMQREPCTVDVDLIRSSTTDDAEDAADDDEEDGVFKDSGTAADASKATAPAPAGSAASDDTLAAEDSTAAPTAAEAELRRGQRIRHQRVVYLHGEPVLKENLYNMEQGEPSVFDRELADGLQLVPGTTLAAPTAAVIPNRRPGRPAQNTKAADPIFMKRMAHNAAVKADTEVFRSNGAKHLLKHMDKLQPFITSKAAARVTQLAAQAPAVSKHPEDVTSQPESIVGCVMRDHQLEGLQWMMRMYDRGGNPILADEMGLGKTLQTISFLAALRASRGVEGPHLVVAPLSVLSSWMSECKRWCPSLRAVRLHTSDPAEKERLKREVLADPSSFDIAVTTYEMIGSDGIGNAIKWNINWRCLILDEGHKVKNELSQLSKNMRQIKRQCCVMLTGTPVQNNLHELYALLSFMWPDAFTDPSLFDCAFNINNKVVDNSRLEAVHQLLRIFQLRRLKEEVEVQLTTKVETCINCPLSEMQTFWYRGLLLKDSDMVAELEGGAQVKGSHVWLRAMTLLGQLRQTCNHPYSFKEAEPLFDGSSTGEDIVTASGKMQVLDRLLLRLKERGHRVVLFSQYNKMLDIIEDFLDMRGYQYRRLDGKVSRVQRMVDIEMFNYPGSQDFIYLVNTRAGGLGVNLQSADTCILYDSDFNPQWDVQAMARVHRIGQTKPVHVYRLVTEGTVEERIQQRASAKLYLDKMVNRGSTHEAEQLEGLGQEELLSMLKFGADRIFKNVQGKPPSDEQLEAILDRSSVLAQQPTQPTAMAGTATSGTSTAAAAAGGLLVGAKQTALSFNVSLPLASTFELNGINYQELRRKQASTYDDIAKEYWDSKRERRERLVMVDGFEVLKENCYSMQEGGISAWGTAGAGNEREQKHKAQRKKVQRAGVDYPHMDTCQICWDGGELVVCDRCPAAYHFDCLEACCGITEKQLEKVKRWSCPQHYCAADGCGKDAHAGGGMLLRCEVCEKAFCGDHLPAEREVIQYNEMYQAMGQKHTSTVYFIRCSEDCKVNRQRLEPIISAVIQEHKDRVNQPEQLVPVVPEVVKKQKTQKNKAPQKEASDKAQKSKPKAAPKAEPKTKAKPQPEVEDLPLAQRLAQLKAQLKPQPQEQPKENIQHGKPSAQAGPEEMMVARWLTELKASGEAGGTAAVEGDRKPLGLKNGGM